MILDIDLEDRIKEKITEYFNSELAFSGRAGWDFPHTLAAVHYIKILCDSEGGNHRILVPVMYFHDTGYRGLSLGYGNAEVDIAKKDHGLIGAEFAESFLSSLDVFSNFELKYIKHLITVHDDISDIDNCFDRQLIMEADSLAQIDWKKVTPAFDKDNAKEWYITNFSVKRAPIFKTNTGKYYLNKLMPLAEEHFSNWKF